MWFLYNYVVIYTENNMPDHSDNPLLKSMIKIFSLFLVQYRFENDWGTGVWIKCTNFRENKFLYIISNSDDRHPSSFYQNCFISLCWFIVDDRNQGSILFYYY